MAPRPMNTFHCFWHQHGAGFTPNLYAQNQRSSCEAQSGVKDSEFLPDFFRVSATFSPCMYYRHSSQSPLGETVFHPVSSFEKCQKFHPRWPSVLIAPRSMSPPWNSQSQGTVKFRQLFSMERSESSPGLKRPLATAVSCCGLLVSG